MTWRSPFADGACTVKVMIRVAGVWSQLFSAPVAAGTSSAEFPTTAWGIDLICRIDVTADGIVEFVSRSVDGLGGGRSPSDEAWAMRVVPSGSLPNAAPEQSDDCRKLGGGGADNRNAAKYAGVWDTEVVDATFDPGDPLDPNADKVVGIVIDTSGGTPAEPNPTDLSTITTFAEWVLSMVGGG